MRTSFGSIPLLALTLVGTAACSRAPSAATSSAVAAAPTKAAADKPAGDHGEGSPACAPSAVPLAPGATPPAGAVAVAPLPAEARRFGAPIAQSAAVKLADVLARPDEYAGKPLLVEGKVRSNCTRKGCWMELAGGLDESAPGCRVTFKDYGFFVPLDARGSDARVEGALMVRTLAPGDVAHLESEGGHVPGKQPDGSAREVRIVASGVALWRQKAGG